MYSFKIVHKWRSLIGLFQPITARLSPILVITFYSPSCLGQETAKGPFGLRVKLPTAHLSTTHGGGFTLSLLVLNVKQESWEYQFLVFGLTQPGIEPESTARVADALSTRPLIGINSRSFSCALHSNDTSWRISDKKLLRRREHFNRNISSSSNSSATLEKMLEGVKHPAIPVLYNR